MTRGQGNRLGRFAPLLLFALAVAVRSALLAVTVDVPGDGPVRAWQAHEWARAPHWVGHGMWLPGGLYLGGLASLLLPDPAFTLRLVNVLAGSLTAPVAFLVVHRLYDLRAAWLTGLAIILLPLHAELSASSLSEPLFVLVILLAELALLRGLTTWSTPPPWPVMITVGLVVFAQATRYEAWVLTPVFAVFLAVASEQSGRALSLALLALCAFPLVWSIANALHAGDPFLGLTAARGSAIASFGPGLFGIGDSAVRIARLAAAHLTPPLALLVAAGIAIEAHAAWRRRVRAPRALHLALTIGFWLFALAFAVMRGPKLYNRYLLLGFVLALPFAGVALAALSRGRPRRWAQGAALVVAAGAVTAGGIPAPGPHWVTLERPRGVVEVGEWLARAEPRREPIVLTPMRWQSTYFLQLVPSLRFELVMDGETDAALRRRLAALDGACRVVTSAGDEALVARLEAAAPRLSPLHVVHEEARFRVLASPACR